MPVIKRIVFDLDNTLFDTDTLIYQAMFQHLADLLVLSGFPGKIEEVYVELIEISRTNPSSKIMEKFLNAHQENKSEWENIFIETFRDFRPKQLYLYPGAWSILELLRKRYQLVLLTEGETEFQEWKIEQLKIRPFFETIFIVGKNGKKDILKSLPNPEFTAVVGDRISNELTCARELGMVPIMFSQGRHQEKRGENWYYRVKSTTQLPEILSQIEGE